MFLANINKTDTLPVGEGALYSILAIVMVFAILLLIIGITTLVFKMQGLFDMKRELDEAKNNCCCHNDNCTCNKPQASVEIEDDDMMAAVLVATIDYQNEVKKDVKVLNVRRVK